MAGSDWVFGMFTMLQAFFKGLREFLIGLTRPLHGT